MHPTTEFDLYTTGGIVEKPLAIGTQDFTITGWVKPTAAHYGMVWSQDRSCLGTDQFRFEYHSDNKIALFGLGVDVAPGKYPSRDPGGWTSALTTQQPLPLNVWTHVSLSRSDNIISLYINGVEDQRYTTPSKVNHVKHEWFRVGSRYPPSGDHAENPFQGEIRETRYWARALTPQEIQSDKAGKPEKPAQPAGPTSGIYEVVSRNPHHTKPRSILIPTRIIGPEPGMPEEVAAKYRDSDILQSQEGVGRYLFQVDGDKVLISNARTSGHYPRFYITEKDWIVRAGREEDDAKWTWEKHGDDGFFFTSQNGRVLAMNPEGQVCMSVNKDVGGWEDWKAVRVGDPHVCEGVPVAKL